MNKIYKIIWSKVKHQYVVVSELAKAHSKGGVRSERCGTNLAQRIFLSMVLASAFSIGGIGIDILNNPAFASEITRISGTGTNPVFNNHKADIYAEAQNGNYGLNRFEKFTLSQGDMANMYFKTAADAKEFGSLFNFVKDDINIHGTVNAIKNSTIGGNLYFFGDNNILIGSSGVINAGSINLITRDKDLFSWQSLSPENVLQQTATEVESDTVAINKNGTITVNGQLNAANDINLRAGRKIDIGNATGHKAKLTTGVTDFTNLVNATDANGNAVTFSDDTNTTLTFAGDAGGDILLNVTTKSGNSTEDIFGDGDETGTLEKNAVAEINIGKGSTLHAQKAEDENAGNITISANASIGDGTATILDMLEDTKITDVIGFMGNTVATIDIGGEIVAENTVDIAANAKNTYVANSLTDLSQYVTNYALNNSNKQFAEILKSLPISADVAIMHSKAQVNVADDAVITANGTDTLNEKGDMEQAGLSIQAKSSITTIDGAKTGAATTNLDRSNNTTLSEFFGTLSSYAQLGSTVNVLDSEASVNIGKATIENTKESVGIGAESKTYLFSKGAVKAEDDEESGTGASAVNLGLSYNSIDNKAKVNVNQGAEIQAKKSVEINSTSDLDLTAEMEVDNSASSSAIALALTIGDIDSSATVDVAGNITAGEDISIEANNEASLFLDASNSQFDGWLQNVADTGVDKAKKFVSNTVISPIKTKLGIPAQEASDKYLHGADYDFEKYFTAGGAIVAGLVDNDATVNIRNTAKLQAGSDVTIAANTESSDMRLSATSNVSTDSDDSQGHTSTEFATAIVYDDLNYKANVVIDAQDAANDNHAVVKAGKNLEVNATSEYTWDRLNGEIEYLQQLIGDIATIIENDADLVAAFAKISKVSEDDLKQYMLDPTSKEAKDYFKAYSDFVNLANTSTISGNMVLIFKLNLLYEEVLAMANAGTYANFNASSATRTVKEDADGNTVPSSENADFSAAGSILINNIANKANVIVGAGSELQGGEKSGSVTVSGDAKQSYFTMAGQIDWMAENAFNTNAKSAAIGGNANINITDVNSTVLVAEGAKLSANKVNVTANSENGTALSVALGGGASDSTGISGMTNWTFGDNNAMALVDDEAIIQASNSVNIKSTNTVNSVQLGLDVLRAGKVGLGASVNIGSYDRYAVAGIVDIDRNDSKELDEDGLGTTLVTRENKNVSNLNDIVLAQIESSDIKQLGSDKKTVIGGLTSAATKVDSVSEGTINNVSVAAGIGNGAINKAGGGAQNMVAGKEQASNLKLNVTGAVSVNTVDSTTASLVEGATINGLDASSSTAAVTAHDGSFIGAYSGAGAFQLLNGLQASNFTAEIAGAAAANVNDSDVLAVIDSSTLGKLNEIDNQATKNGTQLALGLALGVQTNTSQDGLSLNVEAGYSHNYADNDVTASINNSNVIGTGETALNNIAYDTDAQIAGGVTLGYAQSNASIGASVVYQGLNNSVNSTITGGKYTDLGYTNVLAGTNLTQVGGAVSVGIRTGSTAGLDGNVAVAMNDVTNHVSAAISGTDENALVLSATDLVVNAADGELTSTEVLNKDRYANHDLETLKKQGIDVDQADTYAEETLTDRQKSAETSSSDGDDSSDETSSTDDKTAQNAYVLNDKGNTLVAVALSAPISVSSGSGVTVGAAATTNTIDNTYTSKISKANVTVGNNLDVDASSHNRTVSVAAGIGGSTSLTGTGAGAGNTITGSTTASIENSNVANDTGNTSVLAKDNNTITSVVGDVSVSIGSGNASGALGVAVDNTKINRTTEAKVVGSSEQNSLSTNQLKVKATSKTKITDVDTGIYVASSASSAGAVAGTVTVNNVTNNTSALIDNMNVTTADGFDVLADHTLKQRVYGNSGGLLVGQYGANGSIGVSVLNDTTTTTAFVQNSSLQHTSDGEATDTIQAKNDVTSKNYLGAYNAGLSEGVTASVGVAVNNIDTVSEAGVLHSSIGSSDLKAKEIVVNADNTYNLVQQASNGTAGLFQGAVNVAYNNPVSQAAVLIGDGSQLYAKDITVDATENRKVDAKLISVNAGAVSVSGNILVNSIGTAMQDVYGYAYNSAVDNTDDKETGEDEKLADYADAATADLSALNEIISTAVYEKTGDTVLHAMKLDEGTSVTIQESTLVASGNVTVDSHTNNDIDSNIYDVTVSGGTVSVPLNITNIKNNTSVKIDNSTISAQNISAKALADGSTNSYITQVEGDAGSATADYIGIHTDGDTKVSVSNSSTVEAKSETAASGAISLMAQDNTTSLADIRSVDAEIGGAKVFVTDVYDDSDTQVAIDSGNTVSGSGNVNLVASKGGSIESLINGVIVGAFELNGAAALAEGAGTTSVTIGKNKTIQGKEISTDAANSTRIYAKNYTTAPSLAKMGVNIARAYQGSNITTTIDSGNKLTADAISIKAGYTIPDASSDSDSYNVRAFSRPGSIDLVGGLNAAVAKASLVGTTTVDVKEQAYNTDSLIIYADNDTQVNGKIWSMEGGLANVGYNRADTRTRLTSSVTVNGQASDDAAEDGQSKNHLGEVAVIINNATNTNADGTAGAGSIIETSPVAVMTKNISEVNSNVTVNGNWNVEDDFYALADNTEVLTMDSTSTRGTGIGYTAAHLNNDVTNHAAVTVSGNIITTDGNQWYSAQNNVTETGTLKNRMYSAAEVENTFYNTNNTYTSTVNLNNATLTAEKGDIEVEAATKAVMNHKNSITGAGGATVTIGNGNAVIDVQNTINLTGDTSAETRNADQSITMAAYDDLNLTFDNVADNLGSVIGVSTTDVDVSVNRSNIINMNEGSLLQAAKNVNLYAGADLLGDMHTFTFHASSDVYNKSVLPLHSEPGLDYTLNQNNVITISGDTVSAADTNLTAQPGKADIRVTKNIYRLYKDTTSTEALAVTEEGFGNAYEDANNKVIINGSVTAGKYNDLELTISGDVVFYRSTMAGENTMAPDYSKVQTTVTEGKGNDWFDSVTGGVTYDMVTLNNPYFTRAVELQALLQVTEDNQTEPVYSPGTEEYNTLYNEYTNICEQMYQLGYAEREEVTVNGATEYRYSIYDTKVVPSLILPKINVSGGNVNINTTTVEGGADAVITANGVSSVNITSDSNLHLTVDDIVIGDNGGLVKFNDNTMMSTMSSFGGTINSTLGEEPVINITSTAKKPKVTTDTMQYQDADISVKGNLYNANGAINITSANNSVLIHNAEIKGNSVTINAMQGNIVQTSEGLLTVGYDPIAKFQFGTAIAELIEKYVADQALDSTENTYSTYKDSYEAYLEFVKAAIRAKASSTETAEELIGFVDQKAAEYAAAKTSKGIVGASNVYLSGLNVNIDGIVQSGFDTYTGVIDADKDVAATIAAIKADYDAETEKYGDVAKALTTDDLIAAGSKYLVSGSVNTENNIVGGAVYYENKGYYVYDVPIYYNPYTDQLVVGSITTGGGNVYIKGAISSTGSGNIVAASGAADVTIDTSKANVDKELQISDITIHNTPGTITLIDTAKLDSNGDPVTTVITNNNGITHVNGVAVSDDYAYTPAEDMTVTWTGGLTGETKATTSTYTTEYAFYGLLEYNKSKIKEYAESHGGKIDVVTTTYGDPSVMGNGIVIGVDDSFNNYYSTSSTAHKDEIGDSGVTSKKIPSDWWGWLGFGDYQYSWTETTNNDVTTTYKAKADSPISVGFASDGQGNINIHAKNDLYLAGNITTASQIVPVTDEETGITTNVTKGLGSVTLLADDGAISGDETATVNTDSFSFTAGNGDLNIRTAAIGSEATGTAVAFDGDLTLESVKGDLTLVGDNGAGQLTTSEYNEYITTISAVGNIKTAYTTKDVSYTDSNGNEVEETISVPGLVHGHGINLTSTSGGIDAQVHNLPTLNSSGIQATAYGDVVLTGYSHSDEDMRIEHVESQTGDVFINASNNRIVTVNKDTSLSDAQDKIDHWIELGIVSADDTVDTSTKIAEANQKEAMENASERLKSLAAYYTLDTEKTTQYTADQYKTAAGLYAASKERDSIYSAYVTALTEASAIADETKREEAQSTAKAAYLSSIQDFFSSKGYTFTEDETRAVSDYANTVADEAGSYGWSVNELLYSVQSDIINSTPGQTILADTADIKANNITLLGAGIGVDADSKTIQVSDLNKVDSLKLLSNSKAGDLTWNTNEDGEIVSVTVRQQQPITVDLAEGGQIHVESTGNVYLAGVKETTLNIAGSIMAAETNVDEEGNLTITYADVKLMADKGVQMESGEGITGNNLIIYGGHGDIGSEDSPIQADMKGSVDANTDMEHSIYLANKYGGMTIQNMVGDTISIDTLNSIVMSTETGKDSGNLNANTIQLVVSDGDIGTKDNAIRIINNSYNDGSTEVIAMAGDNPLTENKGYGNVYLASSGGGKIDLINGSAANDFVLDAADDDSTTSTIVNATQVNAGNDVKIDADGAITAGSIIAGGNATVSSDSDVTITKIIEAYAGDVTVTAGNDAIIAAAYSEKGDITVKAGHDTSVNNASSEEGGLSVTADNDVTIGAADVVDDIVVEAGNNASVNNVTTEGTIDVDATGNASVSDSTAGKDVDVKSENGTADVSNTTAGENIKVESKEDASVTNSTAGEDVDVKTEGKGKVDNTTADENIKVESKEDASVSDSTAGKDVDVKSENGTADVSNTTAGENIKVESKEDASVSDSTASKDVDVKAETGTAEVSNTTAGENIKVESKEDASVSDSTAGKDVDVKSENGTADVSNTKAGGTIDVDATGNTSVSNSTAGKDVDVDTKGTANVDNTTAGENINVNANDNITMNNVSANNDVNADSQNGNVNIKKITAGQANIASHANNGKGDIRYAGNTFTNEQAVFTNGVSVTADSIKVIGRQAADATAPLTVTLGDLHMPFGLDELYVDIDKLPYGADVVYKNHRVHINTHHLILTKWNILSGMREEQSPTTQAYTDLFASQYDLDYVGNALNYADNDATNGLISARGIKENNLYRRNGLYEITDDVFQDATTDESGIIISNS